MVHTFFLFSQKKNKKKEILVYLNIIRLLLEANSMFCFDFIYHQQMLIFETSEEIIRHLLGIFIKRTMRFPVVFMTKMFWQLWFKGCSTHAFREQSFGEKALSVQLSAGRRQRILLSFLCWHFIFHRFKWKSVGNCSSYCVIKNTDIHFQ